MFASANPLGFLASARAQNVDQIIGKTEQLVTALELTQADLTPAQEALTAAKALYAAREYSEAAAQARRAGALAVSLNDRFNAYMASWTALQGLREELSRLGLPTADLEAVLGAADKEVANAIPEDDAVVPNYLGAKAMLEQAAEDASALLARAREASREIFLATLAVEALSELQPTNTPSLQIMLMEQMIEQATRELALGNVPAAREIAGRARVRAEGARADAARATKLLEETEAILEHLGAEGSFAKRLEVRIRSTRGALANGQLDSAADLEAVRVLAKQAGAFADEYARARKILEDAERVYARLEKEGFSSYEVDAALRDARCALGAGDWGAVRENVGRASQSFVRRRNARDALARAFLEIDERLALLQDLDVPLPQDVHEILGRAKEEFQTGRFSGANEDLLFAAGLVTQAIRLGA